MLPIFWFMRLTLQVSGTNIVLRATSNTKLRHLVPHSTHQWSCSSALVASEAHEGALETHPALKTKRLIGSDVLSKLLRPLASEPQWAHLAFLAHCLLFSSPTCTGFPGGMLQTIHNLDSFTCFRLVFKMRDCESQRVRGRSICSGSLQRVTRRGRQL